MAIIGAFIVPHPPLIMKEVGNGREQSIAKTIESYNKLFYHVFTIIILFYNDVLLYTVYKSYGYKYELFG